MKKVKYMENVEVFLQNKKVGSFKSAVTVVDDLIPLHHHPEVKIITDPRKFKRTLK